MATGGSGLGAAGRALQRPWPDGSAIVRIWATIPDQVHHRHLAAAEAFVHKWIGKYSEREVLEALTVIDEAIRGNWADLLRKNECETGQLTLGMAARDPVQGL